MTWSTFCSRSQTDRQAGDAALELFELTDVDRHDVVAETLHERDASRAVGGHEDPVFVKDDDVRAGLLGHRLEPRE